jgi:predicted acetyltransferase
VTDRTDPTFRPATEADLDRLIEIHASAFPDPRGHEERRRNFTANPLGPLAALWVAEERGEVVAHAFLFPLRAWLAGSQVDVAGIASVGVAPESRGRGIAGKLLTHLHAQAAAAKAPLSLLYAFRQGFYARHGYAATTPSRKLRVHPGSIPLEWRDEPGVTVTRAREGDRAAIVAAQGRTAARSHGWLVRSEALWDRALSDERRSWLVARRGKQPVGYVTWSLAQPEPHGETRMRVHEVAADDDAARRALLGVVGAQRDHVTELEIDVDARDPLDRALLDADRARFGTAALEHDLGALAGGPMVRLVDVARALMARRYPSDGALDLVIDDRPALHVAITRGRGKVGVAERARSPLVITRAALGAVLYGGLVPSDAARIGWARGEDATLARADALFATPPFFSLALDAF